MKKFDLWFPKPMGHANGRGAETAMVSGKSAYIEVVDPFDDGSGQHDLIKSKGHILLYHETTSAEECSQQIDLLIANLQALKVKAQKEFAK